MAVVRRRRRCRVEKLVVVMRESHCLDTNIKHISDLTGTRNRISDRRSWFDITSSTDFTIEFDCWLIVYDYDSSSHYYFN